MPVSDNCLNKWNTLSAAATPEFVAAFAAYYSSVMEELRVGNMPIGMAGLHLAKTLFLPRIEEYPICEAIAQYGGLLESTTDSVERGELLGKMNSLARALNRV